MYFRLVVFVPSNIDLQEALTKYDEMDESFYEKSYLVDSELRNRYEREAEPSETYPEFVKRAGYDFDDVEEKAFESYNPYGFYENYYMLEDSMVPVSSLFKGCPCLDGKKHKDYCLLWDKYHPQNFPKESKTNIDADDINHSLSIMNEFDSKESYANTASVPYVANSDGCLVIGTCDNSESELVEFNTTAEERAELILRMCAEHPNDYNVCIIDFYDTPA